MKEKLFIALTVCFLSLCSYGAAFIPSKDSEVLEVLPKGSISGEVKRLKTILFINQNDPELAFKAASKFIQIGKAESDPRYFGYAESIVNKWIERDSENLDWYVLRATISQYNHKFNKALKDLDFVLKKDKENPQACLIKSNLLCTQGEYLESKRYCLPLLRSAGEIIAIGCASYSSGLNGSAERSLILLEGISPRLLKSPVEEKVWILSLKADLAQRLDKKELAEKYFNQAVILKPNDSFLLSNYADFLLHEQKLDKVINLLKDRTNNDGLLLRLAIAEKEKGLIKESKLHSEELGIRFIEQKLRKDFVHHREEAIYYLKLLDDPVKSLELAKENWQIQKEPIDVRILLESALKRKDKDSIKEVESFLTKTKLEDVNIESLR
jgi:predicted Zn-dependent protease